MLSVQDTTYVKLNLQLGVPQLSFVSVCSMRSQVCSTYRVVVKDSSPIILANPKSAILTVNSLSTSSIFSGLISRWTILRSCCHESIQVLNRKLKYRPSI